MIPILHFTLILLIYISPFVLNWKIILFFILLYYLQLYVFGNCILTIKQFNESTRDTSFYSYALAKLNFYPNKKIARIVVDYFMPWVILFLAIIWQEYLGHIVIINLW